MVIVSLHLHQVQRKSVRRDIFKCSVSVVTVIEEDESMSSNREAEEKKMGMWWIDRCVIGQNSWINSLLFRLATLIRPPTPCGL